MSEPVIKVEGLGKRYTLHHQARSGLLRDRLASLLRHPFRRTKTATAEDFWALRDVNFTVNQGDVVGIIGRNGAGKSTLLKILSRITEPTTGRIAIDGRVASLLEVGTGFHGELSGRENIFLNGAILGMKRAEIRKKFDEIVAFAEVEKFLDTPVKHYSSGMYVRLAFAVAAHLEPEILIVDEVLAVGDAAFQKKCLGKMKDVSASQGRTVLFVSHNMAAVRQLCQTAILLTSGRMLSAGPVNQVLDLYIQGISETEPLKVPTPRPEIRDWGYVTAVSLETAESKPQAIFPVGATWQLRLSLRIERSVEDLVVSINILSAEGTPIQTCWSAPRNLGPGNYHALFKQCAVVLEAGSYCVHVGLKEKDRTIQQFEAIRFDLNGEETIGYIPRTFGVGAVLNSMSTDIIPVFTNEPVR